MVKSLKIICFFFGHPGSRPYRLGLGLTVDLKSPTFTERGRRTAPGDGMESFAEGFGFFVSPGFPWGSTNHGEAENLAKSLEQ